MSKIKGITIEIDGETKGLDKALKDINKSSKDIQKELRQVDKLLKFNPKNTELLAQKQQLLSKNVEQTKKKLEALKQAQDKVNEAFKKGEITGEQYRDFQRELVETESKLKHYQNQLKQVDSSHKTFSDKMVDAGKTVQSFGEGMTSIGKDLTMKVTAPLMAIGTVATKTGMEFKAGMSEVQAISGATASEVEELESKARELGSSTKFSAKEVAEGFKYMSLAGWDVQQSLDAIPGVLDLAAASGEDLALVSDILTDAISAFGDEASDAGRYADVLASAASNANTDVAGLGEAFKYVAPVAGALGYEVEDVATALGLMANQGIKGSSMGTALRNVLTNLVSPTKAMATEMKKYGISIKDSNGEIKPLDQLLKELRGTFSNLSEEQKAQLAATLAGKEGMSGLLAIVNASDEEFNTLSDAIKNSEGAAADMAETMGDNLQGKITNLKSATEELAIKIFENLEPALTGAVEWAQGLVDKFNDLSPSTQNLIVTIGGLATILPPLLVIGGKIVTGVGILMQALPGLIAGVAALGAPVLALVGVVTALGAAYLLLRDKGDDYLQKEKEIAEQNLEAAESRRKKIDDIGKEQEATTELIQEAQKHIDTNDKLIDNFETLREKSKLNNDEFLEYLTLQSELANTSTPEDIARIEERMEALAKKSGLSKEEFLQLISTNEELAQLFPEAAVAVDEYGNAIMGTTEKIRELSAAELERMKIEIYNEMASDIEEVNVLLNEQEGIQGRIFELEEEIHNKSQEKKKIEEELLDVGEQKKANEEELKNLKEQSKEAGLREKVILHDQMTEIKKQNKELDKKEKTLKEEKKDLDEILKTNKKEKKELEGQNKELGTKIQKNRENFDGVKKILETQFDIVLEQGKENEAIDQAIKKRNDEKAKLEEKKRLQGDSNGELQKQIDKINEENNQLSEGKKFLQDHNTEITKQNRQYDDTNKKIAQTNAEHKKQGGYQDANNSKQDIFNGKMKESNSEAKNLNTKLDKNHNKDVKIKQTKDPDTENRKWSKPITKTINFIKGMIPKFADGTNFAPGGMSIVGEAGFELVEHRGKRAILDAGIYDIPRGAKIFPHNETVDMLRSGVINGIGQGVQATKQQVQEQQHNFNITPAPIVLDGNVIGQATFDITNKQLGNQMNLDNYLKGV